MFFQTVVWATWCFRQTTYRKGRWASHMDYWCIIHTLFNTWYEEHAESYMLTSLLPAPGQRIIEARVFLFHGLLDNTNLLEFCDFLMIDKIQSRKCHFEDRTEIKNYMLLTMINLNRVLYIFNCKTIIWSKRNKPNFNFQSEQSEQKGAQSDINPKISFPWLSNNHSRYVILLMFNFLNIFSSTYLFSILCHIFAGYKGKP